MAHIKTNILDIWVGGDTQCSDLKEAAKEFTKIKPDGRFKIAFTYRWPDGSIHETTIRQNQDGIVYIDSNIQGGLY